MLKRLAFAMLALTMAAGIARAQAAEEPEEKPQPVRKIKVLQNPYDISSFYTSHQGEYFGLDQGSESKYPIAGFYRSRQTAPYGYAQFWTSGYGYRRAGTGVRRYHRRIGENGDLFLFAPTFLAPIGPLNGAFFGN